VWLTCQASQVLQSLFLGTAIAPQNRYYQGGILCGQVGFQLAGLRELVVIIA